MARKATKLVAAAALSMSLVLAGVPHVAYATPSDQLQAELKSAQARLNELYARAEQVSEDLNETRIQLADTNARIQENTELASQKQVELDKASDLLAQVVAEDYKNGSVSLASIILGASSLEDIVNGIYAANKVSEHQQEVILEVKSVREELSTTLEALEADRTQKEELATSQEAQIVQLESAADAASDYVEGLSAEVQEAIAREEEARRAEAQRLAQAAAEELAAQQAAEQAAAQQAAAEEAAAKQAAEDAAAQQAAEEAATSEVPSGPGQTQATDETQATVDVDEQTTVVEEVASEQEMANEVVETAPQEQTTVAETTAPAVTEQPATTSEDAAATETTATETAATETASTTSTIDSSVASIVVSAALSQVGVAYVYGTSIPGVSFDCSGLTSYCYSCAGYSIPHSSAGQRVYCTKPASQAVAGDIVWRSGHVGICIGDGKTVEAFYPGMGVGIGSTSSFVYAGSPA